MGPNKLHAWNDRHNYLLINRLILSYYNDKQCKKIYSKDSAFGSFHKIRFEHWFLFLQSWSNFNKGSIHWTFYILKRKGKEKKRKEKTSQNLLSLNWSGGTIYWSLNGARVVPTISWRNKSRICKTSHRCQELRWPCVKCVLVSIFLWKKQLVTRKWMPRNRRSRLYNDWLKRAA
jgi:hypothetical protein